MANPIKDMGEKHNSNGFRNNPQNINKSGQPRKGISLVNHELQKAGYSPATKQDIEANYMSLIQLPLKELTEISKDDNKPMMVRIIAKNMLSGKGFDVIERMLDRGIGKSKASIEQEIDLKNSGDVQHTVNLIKIDEILGNLGYSKS